MPVHKTKVYTFYYDEQAREFLPNGDNRGNCVVVREYAEPEDTPPTFKFSVYVDDLLHVLAAVNRLAQQFVPTFDPLKK